MAGLIERNDKDIVGVLSSKLLDNVSQPERDAHRTYKDETSTND